jgi:hypothetical protein
MGSGANDSFIQTALNHTGANAVIELCPGAVISIYNLIGFTAPGQMVQAQGLPTGSQCATLRTEKSSGDLPTGVFWTNPLDLYDYGYNYVAIRDVILDDNRQNVGGPSGMQHLDGAYVADAQARTWADSSPWDRRASMK